MMTNTKAFTWHVKGINIEGASHTPERPLGVVVLVHGFGEHSGRYLPEVIPFFMNLSLAVIRFDLFGHGISGRKRGHCPSYRALIQLIDHAMEWARGKYPNMPVYLYGHSMGGNLVLKRALTNPMGIKAVIASSPYLRLAFVPPAWKMAVGKLMLSIWPSLTMDAGLDPNGISRIPTEVARYKTDPLVHSVISPVYSFPVMVAGQWALDNAGELRVPTLLLHGTADPIIDCKATEEFHRKTNSSALELFPGGFHELHHDLCKDEYFTAIKGWLQGLS